MKKMNPVSIQIQSVLYKNDVNALEQALDNLANAIRVDRESDQALSRARVCYGDASPEPLIDEALLHRFQDKYAHYYELQYTYFDRNSGTAAGHNRLAKDCDADYLQIMNPDVLVCPHLFARMLEPYSVPELRAGMTEARQTPVEHPKEYDPETGVTSWATTALAIFPTEIYRAVGGFDEKTFFMYCDDLDFSWLIREQGYQIIYVPSAVVFHSKNLSATAGWTPTAAEVYYSAEAALLMYHKWSAPDLLEQTKRAFAAAPEGAPEHKALLHFEKMKEEGLLPAPHDPEHKVAEFIHGNYGKMRFTI